MRFAVVGERQLQNVFEIVGQHEQTAPVRQAVGIKRNPGAAKDGEQAEGDPGDKQQPECRPVSRGRIGLCAGQ